MTVEEQALTAPWSNTWRWNSQAPPPISGQVRTDTRTWNPATHLFVSNFNDAGQDVSGYVRQVQAGSTIDLVHATDPTRSVRWSAGTPLAQSGYFDIPVTLSSSNGTIPNSGTLCTLTLQLPTSAFTISYRVVPVAKRYGRYSIDVTCPHGTLTELNGTRLGDPLLIPIVETTAQNLIRKYGCTCAGLTQGIFAATEGAEAAEVAEAEVASF